MPPNPTVIMTTMICKCQNNGVKVIVTGIKKYDEKNKEPIVNGLLILPPDAATVDFLNQATLEAPVDSALKDCSFRLELSTVLIRNRSNTRTRT